MRLMKSSDCLRDAAAQLCERLRHCCVRVMKSRDCFVDTAAIVSEVEMLLCEADELECMIGCLTQLQLCLRLRYCSVRVMNSSDWLPDTAAVV